MELADGIEDEENEEREELGRDDDDDDDDQINGTETLITDPGIIRVLGNNNKGKTLISLVFLCSQ